jgi:hypothetical protein
MGFWGNVKNQAGKAKNFVTGPDLKGRIAGVAGEAKKVYAENPVAAWGGTAAGVGLLGYGAYRMMGPGWNPGTLSDPVQSQVVANNQNRGVGHDPAPLPPQGTAQMSYRPEPDQAMAYRPGNERTMQMQIMQPDDMAMAKERFRLMKEKQKAADDIYFADQYARSIGKSRGEDF